MEAFHRLREAIERRGRLAIAFSGGRDSTALAHATYATLNSDCAAIMVVTEAVTDEEADHARRAAAQIGIDLHILEMSILSDEEIAMNGPDRCGSCKGHLMGAVLEKARELGFPAVADGAVLDDLAERRPGRSAADRLGIWHPMLEAGITKADVSGYLDGTGSISAGTVSNPCLATRIPFGQRITGEKLSLIAQGERALKMIGFRTVRLRLFEAGNGFLGVLELDDPTKGLVMWPSIVDSLSKVSHDIRPVLDPRGYTRGSMDHSRP